MEVQDLFFQFMEIIETSIGVDNFLEKIKICQTDVERYNLVAPILDGLQLSDLPQTSEYEKCSYKSLKLREIGNECFQLGRLSSALISYTKSIATAPANSQALCFAYANRTAALKSMGYLAESLQDIQRAFDHGYPDDLAYKLHLRQAECLTRLGKYTEALQSFATAISSVDASNLEPNARKNKVDEMRTKLRSCKLSAAAKRKPLSLSELSLEPIPRINPPPLSYGQNAEIQSASDCVALHYNSEFGRHLVATRDIELGDVLIVEGPYVALLHADCAKENCDHEHLTHTHCSHCLTRFPALLPCKNCVWAMFCSAECLQLAAPSHAIECGLMPSLLAWNMNHFSLVILRILSIAGISETLEFLNQAESSPEKDPRTLGFTGGHLLSSDFNAIYHLARNSELRQPQELLMRCIFSWCIVQVMGDLLPDPAKFGPLFLRLFQIQSINSEGIAENYSPPGSNKQYKCNIAGAIYAAVSNISHSCDFNCCRISFGKVEVIQAIQPIKKGSQVTLTYQAKYFMHDKIARQAEMMSRYNFECQCEACEGDWPSYADLILQGNIPNTGRSSRVRKKCELAFENMQDLCPLIGTRERLSNKDELRVIALLKLLHQSGHRVSFAYRFFLMAYEQNVNMKGSSYADKFL